MKKEREKEKVLFENFFKKEKLVCLCHNFKTKIFFFSFFFFFGTKENSELNENVM